MAVMAKPRTRLFSTGRIIALVGAVVIIALIAVVVRGFLSRGATAPAPRVAVIRGPITASVAGIGTIAPAQTVDLSFSEAGSVSSVLVQAGDSVVAGQPLARLDDRVLQSQVASAKAGLAVAQAKLGQATKGNATPNDLAASQAQLASAQASYDKLAAGPSAPDVASAEASLKSSQAHLNDVASGPLASDVASAKAAIQSAQSQLAQSQKDLADLQAQPRPEDIRAAQFALDQAKNSLWSAQLSRDSTCGQTGHGSGPCKSGDANVAVQETAVSAATDKLATAKTPPTAQAMIAAKEAVQNGQASLASAQAKLVQVNSGASAADRQAAQSQVDKSQASLLKTQTSIAATDLAAASASVDLAKANLAKLTASATQSDLDIQQASVSQAEETLKQAQISLDNATLKAPFAGVITNVNAVKGSSATSATPAVQMLDRSTLHVDLKLSENDVVNVAVDQPTLLTIDSLAGWKATGAVSYIAPAATTSNGVATYAVRASFATNDPAVRVGMTANVNITTAHKDDVLLVANTALLPKGSGHVVQQLGADGKTTNDVDVQLGLSDSTNSEVVSGLREGDRYVAFPAGTVPKAGGGPFGG